jgi:hypothetical protein
MSETPRTNDLDERYRSRYADGHYTCDIRDVFDFSRQLERELANVTKQWDESVGVLAALLDKVTDIRGIDMELYAPKEIEAAEQVIKKIKEKIP